MHKNIKSQTASEKKRINLWFSKALSDFRNRIENQTQHYGGGTSKSRPFRHNVDHLIT